MNRETRKSLVEWYLNAETDTAQESMLAEWFATHKAEPEELSVARLILAEHPEAGYDAAAKEFDAIMEARRRRTGGAQGSSGGCVEQLRLWLS